MPPRPLQATEYPTAHITANSAEVQLGHPAEYNELAWARLQLSVGAAAAELAFSLDISEAARDELIETTLHRDVATQLALRDLFEELYTPIAVSPGVKLVHTAEHLAVVVDLDEYRTSHQHDKQDKAPPKPRRARIKEEKQFVLPEGDYSDTEVADIFFSKDEPTRAHQLEALADTIIERLGSRNADRPDENTARSLVTLLKVFNLYRDSEDLLWNDAKAKISRASGLFVHANRGLIRHNVEGLQHSNSSMALDDLVAEGSLGLLESLPRYDLSSTNKVITFCIHRVRGAALDALRSQGSTIRQSRGMMNLQSTIQEGTFAGQTLEEIAEATDIPLAKLEKAALLGKQTNVVSLDAMANDSSDSSSTLGELIADSSASVEEQLFGDSDYEPISVDGVLAQLSEYYRDIVCMRFGFPPYERAYKLKEIGEKYDYTESRASQVIGAALDDFYSFLPPNMQTLGVQRRIDSEDELENDAITPLPVEVESELEEQLTAEVDEKPPSMPTTSNNKSVPPRHPRTGKREYAPIIEVPLESPLQIRRARRRIEEIGRGAVPSDGEEKDTLLREVISHLRSLPTIEEGQDPRIQTPIEVLRQTCYETVEKLTAINIAHWVKKYPPRDEHDRQESESVVRVGLYKAVERFSHDFQNTFIVFANRTVTGELQHYFRDKAVHSSGIPRDQFEIVLNLEKIMGSSGKDLTDAIDELGADPDFVETAIKNVTAYRETTSLDIPEISATTSGKTDNIFSPEHLIEGSLLEVNLQNALRRLKLTDRELFVLRKRLGIARAADGNFYNDPMYDKRSQSEIGAEVGVSQVHISRIIRDIISRLQAKLEIEAEEGELIDLAELFNVTEEDN